MFLSVVTLGEIERGIRQQERLNPGFAADLRLWLNRTVTLFSDRIWSFGPDEARIWGRLTQDMGHSGADLMIAATALTRGATVLTGNLDDFLPTGVACESPF